jgi:hypothetical protein
MNRAAALATTPVVVERTLVPRSQLVLLPEPVENLDSLISDGPTPAPDDTSLFLRQGDYWIIRYQGQSGFFKASLGLNCLALLLRNPGVEFHVIELVVGVTEKPRLPRNVGQAGTIGHGKLSADIGSILDARAKAEYKCRLDELRKDLEEAERFQDSGRAERFRYEIDTLSQHLAAAVGLGGQDRPVGSDAERARSAVTKRIKSSINRIGQVVPALRIHLAARVKTGYFCSYNPHPERLVPWRF